jgi:hypothetical protein
MPVDECHLDLDKLHALLADHNLALCERIGIMPKQQRDRAVRMVVRR